MQNLIEQIINDAQEKRGVRRYLLGIVGAPGAGKTTLAERLVQGINAFAQRPIAAGVPMDGFHLSNAILDEKNLRPLKGIPDTFDAVGLVNLLEALRETPLHTVNCPAFDREFDEPTRDAITVSPENKIVVVEGNYLLLKQDPWNRIAPLLDEAWYIDVQQETIEPRLLERHILGGRSPAAARLKMESTDLPNARLIAATRIYASRIVCANDDGSYSVTTSVAP